MLIRTTTVTNTRLVFVLLTNIEAGPERTVENSVICAKVGVI